MEPKKERKKERRKEKKRKYEGRGKKMGKTERVNAKVLWQWRRFPDFNARLI